MKDFRKSREERPQTPKPVRRVEKKSAPAREDRPPARQERQGGYERPQPQNFERPPRSPRAPQAAPRDREGDERRPYTGPRNGPGGQREQWNTPPRERREPWAQQPQMGQGRAPRYERPARPEREERPDRPQYHKPRPTGGQRPPRKEAPAASRHRMVGANPDGAGSAGLFPEIRRALREVMNEGRRLDKVIEETLKGRKVWEPEERTTFVETVQQIIRTWRWRWKLAGLPEADMQRPEACNEAAIRAVLATVREEHGKPPVELLLPQWLWDRGASEVGKAWPRVVESMQGFAPIFFRANPLRASFGDVRIALTKEGVLTVPVEGLPDALRVTGRRDSFARTAFQAGLYEVQDTSSQRIAPFLEVAPGMRVVDACAGAGGKTLHLAALMHNKGRLIALDTADWRIEELRRRARRGGVDNLEALVIEDKKTLKRFIAAADRVLLDVPCSGLGVLRRHPDTKWKLSTEELQRLCTLQAELLRDYSRMVKPGGKLVYATCSVLPCENERQIRAFLAERSEHWKLDAEITLHPEPEGGDGFYAARLIRLS